MCNKQISFPKNNARNVILSVATILFCLTGCTDPQVSSENHEIILTDYPELAEAITSRHFSSLIQKTDHPNHLVSEAAWRALAQTPTDDIESLFEAVLDSDSYPAWFALSMHSLNRTHLNRITTEYLNRNIYSSSICEIFYRQGSGDDFDFLKDLPYDLANNPKCALALSTIASRSDLDDENVINLFEHAFNDENPAFRNGLVYGFYRASGGGMLFNPAVTSEISRMWAEFGINRDKELDKYMVRILGQRTHRIIYFNYTDNELEEDIQLSIELARVIGLSAFETLFEEMFEYLFTHSNKLVKVQVIESLQAHDELPETLLKRVETEITQRTRNHQLFIESLILLHKNSINVSPYLARINFSADQNPYLLNRALVIYSDLENDDKYFERLTEGIKQGGISGMHSMRALGNYWAESNDALRVAQIRRLINDELARGERSVVAGMQQILMNEELIFDDEYSLLLNAYQQFLERGELDNIQTLRQVLTNRFSERFNPDDEVETKSFRTPNWQRLYDMGTRAYWILETSKGTIEVKLDPLTAPFTVSSIDSLTRAGKYDGVVFHRVVKNFVIQGGDFDRRDGFGGPEYRIPTEPSFKTFERGAAGIASSGPDTEGSQFFFMHQWAPHLDGGYTVFGEVTRGLDVIDRIQIGDHVTKAKISLR